MCLKFFKNKIKKKRSETYLKNSPDRDLSPLLSINGVKISNIERNIYDNRDYERNPLMETLSGSLSPPRDYPSIYQIGKCDEDSDITCSDDSIYFPEPEIK